MAEIKDLSTTDASNNGTAANAGFPESMPPSDVNNAARALEGMIARLYADTNGTVATTGSSNAYLLSPNQTVTAYTDGDTYLIEANHSNTGAATINVSSVGVKSIVLPDGSALTGGEIVSGGRYLINYDGTNFQLFGGGNAGTLSSSGTVRVQATTDGADGFGSVFDFANSAATATDLRVRNTEGGAQLRIDGGDATLHQTNSQGVVEDTWITATQNAGIQLNYNNGARLGTTSLGADVTGSVFQVDNTASAELVSLRIRNSNGGFRVDADDGAANIYQTDSAGAIQDTWIDMDQNAGVTLRYNNSARIASTSAGATVTGTLNATTGLTAGGVAALLAGGELNDLANADKSLGTNGYYTFPGGFTIQWGTATIAGNSTGTAVALPTTFTTAYSGQCTVKNYTTTSAQDTNHSIVSITTTQITIANGIDSSQDYYWVAYGYIAP